MASASSLSVGWANGAICSDWKVTSGGEGQKAFPYLDDGCSRFSQHSYWISIENIISCFMKWQIWFIRQEGKRTNALLTVIITSHTHSPRKGQGKHSMPHRHEPYLLFSTCSSIAYKQDIRQQKSFVRIYWPDPVIIDCYIVFAGKAALLLVNIKLPIYTYVCMQMGRKHFSASYALITLYLILAMTLTFKPWGRTL